MTELREGPQNQPINNKAGGGEVLKRKGLGSIIPQRLRELFNRGGSKKAHQDVPPEPVDSFESEADKPTPLSPTVAHEPQQISINANFTPEPTRGKPREELTTEQDASPIHPDIEIGALHVFEKRLIDNIKIGSITGMEIDIRDLANAWEQAQKAANASFELTPEGQLVMPEKVKEICESHLQEGLASIIEVTEFEVKSGWERGITDELERVAKVFQVAREFEIPLIYTPRPEGEQAEAKTPVVTITTDRQAADYLQSVIDRNLPKGLHSLIEHVGYRVRKGLLSQLPDQEQSIEKWIKYMQQRGWIVVDQPALTLVIGEEKPGLFVREINRGELRQLIEQQVRNNLAKGARYNVEMVSFKVEHGFSDPLSYFGSQETIDLYAEAGRQYGLTHQGGMVSEDTRFDPDLYFDPEQLPTLIQDAVKKVIPKGLAYLQHFHLEHIRSGNVNGIIFTEKTLKEYMQLAEKYEVPVNSDKIMSNIAGHINTDNLMEGVKSRIAAVREDIRKAHYTGVSVESRRAEEFRKFVHDRGFDTKIDFSELDKYLEETATQAPRLTEPQK